MTPAEASAGGAERHAIEHAVGLAVAAGADETIVHAA